MQLSWQARQGEVVVCLEEAEWWGASLAVLVAAIHHPHLLAEQQPDNDPSKVAREVRSGLDELLAAVACAEEQGEVDQLDRPRKASVRREGDTVVLPRRPEVANLALCLTIFTSAVLEPGGQTRPRPGGQWPMWRRRGLVTSARPLELCRAVLGFREAPGACDGRGRCSLRSGETIA